LSTRTDIKEKSAAITQQGNSIPEDYDVPTCTIEDVDRSVFELFDKQLPFTYKLKEGIRKAPVIFATGERFAVLRRKEPLRDKSGALILPLISIMRTGVTQAPTMGAGTNQNADLVVKKRLSEKDPLYQNLINKLGLVNSDNMSSPAAKAHPMSGSLPGRLATRRPSPKRSVNTLEGKLLVPELGKNIFEIITMPPPKYYTATYEVTFWSQYTQQMNNMLMSIMSLYQSYSQRTFRLESPKGYWFVGYFEDALTPGNNFDDFTDSERIVRYSFNITVPAYIVGFSFDGAQSSLRRYLSAPDISFTVDILDGENFVNRPAAGIPAGDTDAYILDNIRTVDDLPPGQVLGIPGANRALDTLPVANIAGAQTTSDVKTVKMSKNPFTGQVNPTEVLVKSRNRRSGETVLRIIFETM